MADRRRTRRKKGTGAAGCLCALALLTAVSAFGAYALPWAQAELGGMLKKIAGKGAKETVNDVPEQAADFPELTVTEEEVADDFYCQQLSEREQTIYREILQGVMDMEDLIRIHATEEDDVGKIYEYLLYDHPELFWCAGNTSITIYDGYAELTPGYTCSLQEKEERQAQIDEAAQECLSGIDSGSSDYEKIKYIFEYIVNTVEYDENAPDNQNIYSSMVGKRSVCAGYSRMAQYLLIQTGIPCIYVIGEVEGQGSHAWNIVDCGGKYYQMDVTFADPVFYSAESGEALSENVISYDYLCCTDAEIMTDHVQSTKVSYPVCDSDDLNYYKMNGMYYDSFDPQIMMSALNESIQAGEDMFVCKFSDAGVYAMARESMTEDLFPRAVRNLAEVRGMDSVRYTYIEDEKHWKMMVFWNK